MMPLPSATSCPACSSRCSGDRCLSAEGELAGCKHRVSQPSIMRHPIMSLAASCAVKFGWLRKVAERPEITYNTRWHCFVRVPKLHHEHLRNFGYPRTRIRFIKSAGPGTCNGRSLLLLSCSCEAKSIPRSAIRIARSDKRDDLLSMPLWNAMQPRPSDEAHHLVITMTFPYQT